MEKLSEKVSVENVLDYYLAAEDGKFEKEMGEILRFLVG
jgi:hypothetical protein